jgi:methionyl-tRNA synthetase
MKPVFYITTPIYYVNDVPHIGHAYTNIASDFVARFKRLDGYDVFFLTGTDEHGQKIERAAQNRQLSPNEFVDQVSGHFTDLTDLLLLSNNDFIRTTEERHKKAARYLWERLVAKGHIYKGKYSGWYSVRDETYFEERELVDGKAPTGAAVEWLEEESYFFNLSHWQERLLAFYRANPEFVLPNSRFNEIIKFVERGLEDLSISRSTFKWGIEVPGDEQHVMYVWFDALTNYLSAVGYPGDVSRYWPADIHMVGKDISRFHAIYWPAILMAADLEVPKQIVAHGWWTVNGEKMSKSLGNSISPKTLIEEFGIDQTRYFLIREIAFGNDGNFSRSSMINRINAELANNIGNLIQRTLSMVFKNCAGRIPDVDKTLLYGQPLLSKAVRTLDIARDALSIGQYHNVLEAIIDLANNANLYIDEMAPWSLAKTNVAQMELVLTSLVEVIRYIGILMQIITPLAAKKILDALSITNRDFAALNSDHMIQAYTVIEKPEIIFPRFEA